MSLPSEYRLKRSKDFSWVYAQGQKAVSRNLVVRAAPMRSPSGSRSNASREAPVSEQVLQSQQTQFGISISQKVSKRAVDRNLIKRRLKAAIRVLLPRVSSTKQVVILVRAGSVGCEYVEFLRQLEHLLKKLEIIDGHS